jgi:hypothetical protein
LFFHLRDDRDEILDPDGNDLPDREAMERYALMAARGIMAGDIANGILDLRYRIDVESAAGETVYSLRFRDAFSIVDC